MFLNGKYLPASGKAEALILHYNAEVLSNPIRDLADIPQGKYYVVVVDNRMFDAALVVSSEGDMKDVHNPEDTREMSHLLVDKDAVKGLITE